MPELPVLDEVKPRAERCETCRFWRDRDETRYVFQIGECHRFAPVAVAAMVPGCTSLGAFSDEPQRGIWPETDSHDWCGEYRPTNDAAPAEPGRGDGSP